MEPKLQTKPNDQNRMLFYQQLYHHQRSEKSQLINLNQLTGSTVIMVDCCGWYYKNMFPEKSIIGLEGVTTIKNFKLDKTHFDKMFDDQRDDVTTWPTVRTDDCAIVFDRSPLLKYRSLEKISTLLTSIATKYQPSTIVVKQLLMFTDDTRTVDRFYNFAELAIADYFVKTFEYNAGEDYWYVMFQRKLRYSD
jgi:hypothetical protein